MMSESNFASLGPTLLARKGGAKPAMRPQLGHIPTGQAANLEDLGWNDMGEEDERKTNVINLTPEPENPDVAAEAHEQDLVEEAKLAEKLTAKPAVRAQQEAIVDRLEGKQDDVGQDDGGQGDQSLVPSSPLRSKATAAPRPRRSALDRGKRAAFTLRLDQERHLKLRLASTMRNKSAQQLVTEALDQLLGEMPELESLAAQMAHK